MAEDQASRTEQATPKRRDEAFQNGQFAQSPDVAVALSLIAAFVTLVFAMPGVAGRVMELGAFVFGNLQRFEVSTAGVGFWSHQAFFFMGALVFPIVAAAMFSGIVAGGLQSGFRLTPKVLELKWERLSPVSGIQRVISKDVLVRLGIDLLKLAALGAVLWAAISRILDDPIFYTPVDVSHVGQFIGNTTLYMLVRIAVAVSIIAVISYVHSWRKTNKDLMMSKEEVKQERKNQEIDPHVKAAQRALARRLLQRQMLQAVPTADVVVTNPTHFAVALKYERGRDRAPVVVARGRDVFARRIKELAARHEVPMVENRPVARALFKYGQVGKEIPVQLYQAVAEILGFVYRTHRYYFHRLKARRLGLLA